MRDEVRDELRALVRARLVDELAGYRSDARERGWESTGAPLLGSRLRFYRPKGVADNAGPDELAEKRLALVVAQLEHGDGEAAPLLRPFVVQDATTPAGLVLPLTVAGALALVEAEADAVADAVVTDAKLWADELLRGERLGSAAWRELVQGWELPAPTLQPGGEWWPERGAGALCALRLLRQFLHLGVQGDVSAVFPLRGSPRLWPGDVTPRAAADWLRERATDGWRGVAEFVATVAENSVPFLPLERDGYPRPLPAYAVGLLFRASAAARDWPEVEARRAVDEVLAEWQQGVGGERGAELAASPHAARLLLEALRPEWGRARRELRLPRTLDELRVAGNGVVQQALEAAEATRRAQFARQHHELESHRADFLRAAAERHGSRVLGVAEQARVLEVARLQADASQARADELDEKLPLYPLDEEACSFLEELPGVGEYGREKATAERARARELVQNTRRELETQRSQQRLDLYDAEPFAPWVRWWRKPERFARVLCDVLWAGRVADEVARVVADAERRQLPLVLVDAVGAVVSLSRRGLQPGRETDEGAEVLHGGETVGYAPNVPLDRLRELLETSGTLRFKLFVAWVVGVAHLQRLQGSPRPGVLEVEGGFAELARLVASDYAPNGKPTKSAVKDWAAELPAILSAGAEVRSNRRGVGTLWGFFVQSASYGRRARVQLVLTSMLAPTDGKGSGARVPLPQSQPPYVGRRNEKSAQLALLWLVLSELRTHAETLRAHGYVRLDLPELAKRAGVPGDAVPELVRAWTLEPGEPDKPRGENQAPAVLRRVGSGFDLGPSYAEVRDELLRGAGYSARGRQAGRISSAQREKTRPRQPRKPRK